MAPLSQLRAKAKEMGIPASEIRGAGTSEELQAVIDSHRHGNSSGTKPQKKAAVKKAVAKKSTRKPVRKAARKSAPATTKKSERKVAAKKSSAVKSKPAAKKSAAKRSTARKTTTRKVTDTSGRHLLNGVDFNYTDGWNARDGSAPDRIIKALKRFRGNREKVFSFLEGNVWDFVGKKFANGEKRSKSDALNMLEYRIARTAWDFAIRTGQHEKSGQRAEYGTAGTGTGVWKSAAARQRAAKRGTAKKSIARKSGATKKSTARRKTTKR